MSKILYFDDTKGFCQGVAAVKFENKWGAIDMKGNQIIPFVYDSLGKNYFNKIIAGRDGKKGIVDTKNNIVVPFIYDDIGSWEQFFEKDSRPLQEVLLDNFLVVKQANKYGVINKEGHEILRCEYDEIIQKGDALRIKQGKKYMYASENTGEIISENLPKALIEDQETLGVDDIDSEDNPFVIIPQYDSELKNIIDKTEKDVCLVDLLGNGLKLVILDGKYGVVNNDDNMILPIEYGEIYAKHNFLLAKKNNKYGLFTDKAERITDDIYDEINVSNTKYIIVKNNNLYGVLSDNGKIILPIIYDYIDDIRDENDPLTSNLLKFIENNIEEVDKNAFYSPTMAKLNNKYGFLDFSHSKARTIIPFEYDVALNFVNNFCAVQKNGKWFFLNSKGEALINNKTYF
jgi:hypothetical protein